MCRLKFQLGRKNPSILVKHKLFLCFCTLRQAYSLGRNTFLIPLSATQVLRLDYEICIRNNDYSLFEQIVETPPCNLVLRPSLPPPLPPQGCVRLVPISRKLKVKPPNYLASCFERIRIASLLLHIFGSSENKHCRFW